MRSLPVPKKAGRWLFGDKAFERGEVTLVANAIETDKYGFSESNRRKIREKLGISGDALVVGHVGRFQVQKNHEAILRIFHEIQRKEPAARLCLIGDGELKEQIQEQAKKAGVLDKIILREYVRTWAVLKRHGCFPVSFFI